MTGVFRHGFKAEAARIALAERAELGLGVNDPLDPWALAEHWGVPVYPADDMAAWGCSTEAIDYIASDGLGRFDAMLVPHGTGRFIIENTTHAITRRHSTISHEMAHVILEHEFGLTILSDDKCRAGDPRAEAEADWLGGELLIPTDAAKVAALAGATDAEVALHFHVSERRAAMRMNVSGARTIALRRDARRGARG
jgi:hypothetical protein